MSIMLGKKSMEVERLFSSMPSLSVYKPMKVEIEASETPKDTIINVRLTVQCSHFLWWGMLIEKCKQLFSRSNSKHK